MYSVLSLTVVTGWWLRRCTCLGLPFLMHFTLQELSFLCLLPAVWSGVHLATFSFIVAHLNTRRIVKIDFIFTILNSCHPMFNCQDLITTCVRADSRSV